MGKNRRQAVRHGYVVIDKPAGWTSHDVVARVRRIVDERRAGHAGTLDPAAVGVLPIAVGLATRTVEYLAASSKAYRAWITFGISTDSADCDGAVIATRDASQVTPESLHVALEAFRGDIAQRPPMHSAIKVDGQRLYQLARAGVEIDVAPRHVTIHEMRIVDWQPPVLCLDVECSKGTYIRSLARDLGDALGTGAHLSGLVRTRSGPFTRDQALSLDELASAMESSNWDQVAHPPEYVMHHLSPVVLEPGAVVDWYHGKSVDLADTTDLTSTIRAYDARGNWLGVGAFDAGTGRVRPVKVIPTEPSTP
jgi:tRNA pseudouridine55 synthase